MLHFGVDCVRVLVSYLPTCMYSDVGVLLLDEPAFCSVCSIVDETGLVCLE